MTLITLALREGHSQSSTSTRDQTQDPAASIRGWIFVPAVSVDAMVTLDGCCPIDISARLNSSWDSQHDLPGWSGRQANKLEGQSRST